jgi:hypothetical protein
MRQPLLQQLADDKKKITRDKMTNAQKKWAPQSFDLPFALPWQLLQLLLLQPPVPPVLLLLLPPPLLPPPLPAPE